jgi:general stress protein 26
MRRGFSSAGWSDHQLTLWERAKEALIRDWEQTKFDLGAPDALPLSQSLTDTLRQASGEQTLPPRNVPNRHGRIDAVRFGYLSASALFPDPVPWSLAIESELERRWLREGADFDWDLALPHVRYGWEYAWAVSQSAPLPPPSPRLSRSPEQTRAHLMEVLHEFKTAMFITHRSGSYTMHGRPMNIAEVAEDGEITFSTSLQAEMVDELVHNPEAVVVFQAKLKYASISGAAIVSKDRHEIDRLWDDSWNAFFKGKEDPTLCLVKVRPRDGEYWDMAGLTTVRFWLEAATSFLMGEKPAAGHDDRISARVSLNHEKVLQ